MRKAGKRSYKIFDPESRKAVSLERLIEMRGTLAIAARYGVSESTVIKWKKGIHRPSRRSLEKAERKLF